MIITKRRAWAQFGGLMGLAAVGAIWLWNWASFGHLSAAQVPALEFAIDAEPKEEPTAAMPVEPTLPPLPLAFAPVEEPVRVRICWRTGLRAGIDCWLVEELPKTPATPDKKCRECLY